MPSKKNNSLRVVLMGTPDFSVLSFEAVLQSHHDVVAIYTQPPRPRGRGHKVQKSPVHMLGEQYDIPVYTPQKIRQQDNVETFQSLKPDIAIVAAYGQILPQSILETPIHGCINIHASLLPRWRGASPIHHAIWKGDNETGITLMQMDEGMDTGDMIAKKTLPITDKTTLKTLHDNLAHLSVPMVMDVLKQLENGEKLMPEPQNSKDATYAPLLLKSDGRVDWSDSAEAIDRQIRALNTFTIHGDKRIKILQSIPVQQEHSASIGTILNAEGGIACGHQTVINAIKIQLEGKKPMAMHDAMNGGLIHIGDCLK